MVSCVCTVLAVKPFSGYYLACQACFRKLKEYREDRYLCSLCHVSLKEEEALWRYHLALSVKFGDSNACASVSVFGSCLDHIFGAPAAVLHR